MIDIMAEGKRWTNLDANGNLVNDPAQLAALNANTTMWSPYTSYVLTDWAVEDGSFLRPVSYTHLDVYKRQQYAYQSYLAPE